MGPKINLYSFTLIVEYCLKKILKELFFRNWASHFLYDGLSFGDSSVFLNTCAEHDNMLDTQASHYWELFKNFASQIKNHLFGKNNFFLNPQKQVMVKKTNFVSQIKNNLFGKKQTLFLKSRTICLVKNTG